MIEIEGLSYTFSGATKPALRDLSLQIGRGEFVLLTGPSGAGKSTLLRCLNGLVPHFSGGAIQGRVRIAGLDPIAHGPGRLSQFVGFVGQNPEAAAVLDRVEPEIAFGLENAAIPRQEMRWRVDDLLALLELTPLRRRRLATLSSGERQRVVIAAALVLRPQILVLDEPTSQLDPLAADDVLAALLRLNRKLGLTIVLVEHRVERVAQYASRMLLLEDGKITLDAPPRQALMALPERPPLAELAVHLGWSEAPLSTNEARRKLPPSVPWLTPQTSGPNGARREQLLSARDLYFRYSDDNILRGIHLAIHQGEVIALMGRNGSGKTTLLKCLVGLLRPQRGQIAVAGRSTSGLDVAEICRDVAYLPQNPDDLLFAETVKEELEATLRNHGLPILPSDINGLLHQLGLKHVADAYPRDLSVGQRQRVALGAVAVTKPTLYLLDEPTRGLDAGAKRELARTWASLRATGRSILLATHDVELAAATADRIILLEKGEIVADGRPADVLPDNPAFAPQISRLFPEQRWLTVEDVMLHAPNPLSTTIPSEE